MASPQRAEAARRLKEMLGQELEKALETESAKEDIILEQEQEIARLTKSLADINALTMAVKRLTDSQAGTSSSTKELITAMDRMTASHEKMCAAMEADRKGDRSEERMHRMEKASEKREQAMLKAILEAEKRIQANLKLMASMPPPITSQPQRVSGFKHEVTARDGNGDIRVILTTPVKGD